MIGNMHHLPHELKELIHSLRLLPGVGARTAERFAFHLLECPNDKVESLGHLLSTIKTKIKFCDRCGLMLSHGACFACDKPRRDPQILCVVATAKEALKIEESGAFSGLYHVLGGLISPLDGKAPDALALTALEARLEEGSIEEVILALDSTIEGDATSLYIKDKLSKRGLCVTRLALGLPIGSSLDYVDEGTLLRSMQGRQRA